VDWVLWWRHTTASTTSSEFIVYRGKQGSGIVKSVAWPCSYWEQEKPVIATFCIYCCCLQSWCKHPYSYIKQRCGILLSLPSAAGGCADPSLQIDMAVLMSSSHRLLILHSPQWTVIPPGKLQMEKNNLMFSCDLNNNKVIYKVISSSEKRTWEVFRFIASMNMFLKTVAFWA
jgi:hypothetical protein